MNLLNRQQSPAASRPGPTAFVLNLSYAGLEAMRNIRQFPMESGRGSLAETMHEPDLASYGLEFFRRIGYRGFGTIEFKRNDRNGLLKVVDLNPLWVKPTAIPVSLLRHR